MKIEFHREVLAQQCYGCNCCGAGCRSFLVPLEEDERRAIESRCDWREKLGVAELWVRSRAAGAGRRGLAKRTDGGCVFLDEDNLCLIHRLYGLRAKPLACQLYPFVLTPFAGTLRVGLRFDCPAVCQNQGGDLVKQRPELQRLADTMVPAGAVSMALPGLTARCNVSAERLEALNEVLIEIVGRGGVALHQRLHWMRLMLEHIGRIRWQKVGEDDLGELVAMLREGLLVEAEQRDATPKPVTGKPRKLLGQYFFFLSQPTTIVHTKKPDRLARLGKRLGQVESMKQLSRTAGALPRIQPDWPECDLAALEESFGAWPEEVQQMLSRYLICRLGGMNYFGPNFYKYSLVEGGQSLLLAMVTVGWLMRISAAAAGRDHIELGDAYRAVMAIDGNLGYSEALGFGPARWRLSYLRDHIGEFIDRYCQ